MIFLQGSEVIFKVALSLLGSHKPLILQHENLETIVDFIKNTLPNLGLVQMEKTISQVWTLGSPDACRGSVCCLRKNCFSLLCLPGGCLAYGSHVTDMYQKIKCMTGPVCCVCEWQKAIGIQV
jgi:hypothetical protein